MLMYWNFTVYFSINNNLKQGKLPDNNYFRYQRLECWTQHKIGYTLSNRYYQGGLHFFNGIP